MKKLFALIALWPLLLSAQPVRLQFGTTNSGTVLTNINKSLATNVVSGNAIAKESGFGTNATFLGTTVIGNGRAFDSGLTATLGVMTEVFRGENLLFWTDQNNRGIMFTLDGVNCLAKVFVSDSAGKLIFDAQSISLTSEGNNSIIQLGFAGANGGTVKIQKDGSASNGSNRPTKRFNFNTSVWNGSGAQDFMLSLRGIVPGTTNNAERFLEFTQSSDDNGTEETRMALLSTNSLTLSVPLVTTQAHYTTNVSATATAPDFTKGYTLVSTNAAFTVLAPVGVDTTKTLDQTTVFYVTNSTAVAIAITAPANVHQVGTWFCTNLTAITFSQHAQKWTNAIALPIW